MHSLRKHPLVDCDLEEAALWYGRRDPALADTFIQAAEAAIRAAAHQPLIYSVRFSNVRRINLSRFPYAVFYEVLEDTVHILSVAHAARDHRALLKGRQQ